MNLGHFIVYTILAVYLTEVLPDANGVRKPVFFFFMPSFWNPSAYKRAGVIVKQQDFPAMMTTKEADVLAEENKMKARLEGCAFSLDQ